MAIRFPRTTVVINIWWDLRSDLFERAITDLGSLRWML